MSKPHYGIDAPGVVRFFLIAGAVTLALLVLLSTSMAAGATRVILCSIFAAATIYLLSIGGLMIYSSKVMKIKDNERLLGLIAWSGGERVLDIGCGRGLMLIGAAKRLTTGKAIGVDLWQEKDQANNSALATSANAGIEGVAQRVEIQTADMRKLPFPDDHFDVITSSWAIHNLEIEADRETTLDEVIRVLKPGGTAIINDIINHSEYANYLRQRGLKSVQLHGNGIRNTTLKIVTLGEFAPFAISGRKGL